jgi:hypothetical protein
MKTLKTALLASTLMVASTASFATSYNLGVISESGTAKTISYDSSVSSFSDTFSFSFANPLGEISTGTLEVSSFLYDFFSVENMNVSVSQAGSAVSGPFVSGSYFSVTPGLEYVATVTGDITGTVGGTYGFAVTSPVPEASTLSLMMAGFGLVGLMSYRRRNSI